MYSLSIAFLLISVSCTKDKCELTDCQNESTLNKSNCACVCSFWFYGETCNKNIKQAYFGKYIGTFTERNSKAENVVQWTVSDVESDAKTFKIVLENNIEWYCRLTSPTMFTIYWDNLEEYTVTGSGEITDLKLEFNGAVSKLEFEKETKTGLKFRGTRT